MDDAEADIHRRDIERYRLFLLYLRDEQLRLRDY